MFAYYYWPVLGFIVGSSALSHKYQPESVDERVFFVDYISAWICMLLVSLVGAHIVWKRYSGEVDRELEDGFIASYVTTESVKFIATGFLRGEKLRKAEFAVLALSLAYTVAYANIPKEYAGIRWILMIHWTAMIYCAIHVIQQGYMVIFWSLKCTEHSKIVLGFFRLLRQMLSIPALVLIRYDYAYPSDIPHNFVLGWLACVAVYLDTSTYGVGTRKKTVLPQTYRPAPPQFSLLPEVPSNPFQALTSGPAEEEEVPPAPPAPAPPTPPPPPPAPPVEKKEIPEGDLLGFD